jgi:hypothetical protein
MLYPLMKRCDTQPRITVRNITLRNIHSRGGYLVGIVRCNATNPCTNINFENVNHDGFFSDFKDNSWITENVYGSVINSHPNPHFNTSSTSQEIDQVSEIYKEFLSQYNKAH